MRSILPTRLRTPVAVSFVTVLGTLAGLAPLGAQTPGREPAVAELPPGARTLGLGLAPQLGDDTPDLAATHPALVTRLGGVRAGHTWFGNAGGSYSLSAASDWLGGGVAVSVATMEYRAASSTPGGRTLGLDEFVANPAGGTSVSESAATVTYGRSIFGVSVGASGRFFTQRYGDERDTGHAMDVGVAHELGPVRLALSARNLGSAEALPTEVVLGAGAYGRPLGPLDLGFAAQVARRDDGEVVVGGGMEFGYWPIRGRTFVGRIGLRSVPEGEASPVTLGGSFWADEFVFDYAFQSVDGLEAIHRITVGWR